MIFVRARTQYSPIIEQDSEDEVIIQPQQFHYLIPRLEKA